MEREHEWLTAKQAAAYLLIGRDGFRSLRKKGLVKDYYPLGPPTSMAQGSGKYVVRFSRTQLDEYMRECVVKEPGVNDGRFGRG